MSQLPTFNIDKELVLKTVQKYIKEKTNLIQEIKNQENHTYDNTINKISDFDSNYELFFSEYSYLRSVNNRPDLDEAAEETLPSLIEFSLILKQDKELLDIYLNIYKTEKDPIKKQVLDNKIKSIELSGINLPEEKKEIFNNLSKRLGELSNNFSINVKKSKDSWEKILTKKEIEVIPDFIVNRLIKNEKEEYILTLQSDIVQDILTYCSDRDIREEVYKGYTTIASELSNDGLYDNSSNINEILSIKREIGLLLGFNNYAELSISKKMADSPEQVLDFLYNIKEKAYEKGKKELEEVKTYALNKDGIDLKQWDLIYYSNLLKNELYKIDSNKIKEYFVLENCVHGLFWLIHELFSVEVKEVPFEFKINEEQKLYGLYKENKLIAYILADFCSRTGKKGGAWMNDVISKNKDNIPVAFVTCNFSNKTEDTPSLLSFRDVETLFHEFGHALQHTLTEIEDPEVSGISGVPWDAVELASQFMEYFCLNEEVLKRIGTHYETKEIISSELINKIKKSNSFQSGLFILRQLQFGIADMKLHMISDSYEHIYDSVKSETSLFEIPEYNRFLNSFEHIFSGGYSAGYYSYLWANVLAADCFESFEEEGTISKKIGNKYLKDILSKGGSEPFMNLFYKFKEREPNPDAFLKSIDIL